MTTIHHIRLYHATLAILSITCYLTAEYGIIHSWLGYAVVMLILFRFLWAIFGDKQVGLSRFKPSFIGLNANNFFTHPAISRVLIALITLSLIAVSVTGLIIDKGRAIGLANFKLIDKAYANSDDSNHDHHDHHEKRENSKKGKHGNKFLMEMHELFANLMLFFVGVHVVYLFSFRSFMAKYMLFISNEKSRNK